MPGTHVVLVRHGQTAHNVSNQISTRSPGGALTALGRRQAVEFAAALADRRATCVYTSHLLRARQTAEIVATALGVPLVVDEDLREFDAGELDGRADLDSYAILDGAMRAWADGKLGIRVGHEGEMGHEIVNRLRGLLYRLHLAHPGDTIVAVTHGGLIEVAVPWVVLNLPRGFGCGSHLGNCSAVDLVVTDSGDVRCEQWEGRSVRMAAPPTKAP